MKKMLGVIQDGKLAGKVIILQPRNGLRENEWLVQDGNSSLTGQPAFKRFCLVCDEEIPVNGCPKHNKKD